MSCSHDDTFIDGHESDEYSPAGVGVEICRDCKRIIEVL